MADEDRRAWEGVLRHVERQLTRGELGPGDRLPSERALAVQLDVGRSSVREAMRVLEVMGLVRNQTGSGPSAGATIVSRPAGGLESLMRLQVAAQGLPVQDVVRTRLLLEAEIAAELSAADPSLGAAETLLDRMEDPALDPREFLALDARFHVALAEAADNRVVAALMAGLRGAIEGYVLEGTSGVADWPAMALRLRSEHRGILAAIAGGDAEIARHAVREHISGYYRDTHVIEHAARGRAG